MKNCYLCGVKMTEFACFCCMVLFERSENQVGLKSVLQTKIVLLC